MTFFACAPPRKAFWLNLSKLFLGAIHCGSIKKNCFSYVKPNFGKVSACTAPVANKRKAAFTLAEVLITLGIIGVVAALTMPTLIEKHQKKVVETHLARFYSIMSQAVLRYQTDANMLGESIVPFYNGKQPASETIQWFKNTIGPYIKTLSIDQDEKFCHNARECFAVKLADGSVFSGYQTGYVVHIFYCVNPNKNCSFEIFDGQSSFVFDIKDKFYPHDLGLSRDVLLERCRYGNSDNSKKSSKNRRHACAALIQMDGWKIKEDYPWNQEFLEEE